jgi:hypothetical protein
MPNDLKVSEYIVKKPCRPVAEPKVPGDEVSITGRQAKYLLMSGHLELKSQTPKPKKTAAK